MSFIIKGGYDAIRKQALNISLKRTHKWIRGIVFVKKNMCVGCLTSLNENVLEIVKYDDTHALLLNNAIIYEDKKLFTYKLDLQCEGEPVLNDKYFYDFIEYKYVDYTSIKQWETLRSLN
jgi:hypothetical protein